jgi:hypothetical protein
MADEASLPPPNSLMYKVMDSKVSVNPLTAIFAFCYGSYLTNELLMTQPSDRNVFHRCEPLTHKKKAMWTADIPLDTIKFIKNHYKVS